MSVAPEAVTGRVGEVVSVTVPNWASAGFAWHSEFRPQELQFVATATVGPDADWPQGLRFSFRMMAAEANLRLVLKRRGAPARETRDYVIGSGAKDC